MNPPLALRTAFGALVLIAAAAPDPVVAVRGADQITASQVRALIAGADPTTRARLNNDPKALQDAIRNALLQRGVLQAARAVHWDRRPDIVALLNRTRDAEIAQTFLASHAAPPPAYPSDAEIQAAYQRATPQLMQPRGYHLAQLFITLPHGAPPAATGQATKTLAALRNAFAAPHAPASPPLALPQGVQSADLGWVAEDRLQPAARDAVSGLLEGQVAPPVCTPAGCALLKLLATRPAGPPPLADVRDGLVRLMRQQKERQGEQAYADTLLAQDPVRIDEIQLSHLTGH
jgi:hypothetical protein